jgi:hypothetical protein
MILNEASFPLFLRRSMAICGRELDGNLLAIKPGDVTELRVIFVKERQYEIADHSYLIVDEGRLRAAQPERVILIACDIRFH